MTIRSRAIVAHVLQGVMVVALAVACSASGAAQSVGVGGTVRDETGRPLPGVAVQLRANNRATRETVTDRRGEYRFESVDPGPVEVSFTLVNFAIVRRQAKVPPAGGVRVDAALQLSLNADVTVTGKETFTNLADVADPASSLVGIAQSASQGAITARQLDARPIMRAGEVLETVPGMVISQHSGEGKANQYYLRGFNLDHGTDFATTVAGMPVNMPTHGHGQGYSDVNFLIPELVSGVQFSKGPYFADQGDFAAAGAANINYVSRLPSPIVRLAGGGEGFGRALAAGSHGAGPGTLLAAVEVQHNNGPWVHPDNYRKVNALLRFSGGDALNGFAVTAMGYRATWSSTDQIPERAVADGRLDRFGTLDPTDGGDTYRYSGSFEWQRTRGNAATHVNAYGIAYDLNLFSNFTFYLDDPVNGDQFRQADHRFVSGMRASHRRIQSWRGRAAQTAVGVEIRNDDITNVGLYHTRQREIIGTVRQDAVLQTSAAVYAQEEIQWTSWLRTLSGVRADGYRFDVDAGNPLNGGIRKSGIVSPKAGAVIGPWRGTELYVNAGMGFHSNDARGATIAVDPKTGEPAERVTPLVRARGSEAGVRTIVLPHLQTSLSIWRLGLDSELLFVGDAGSTEPSRPSRRHGIEWTNYYSPRPWLIFDGDLSVSRAAFVDDDPAGPRIPGAVGTVLSAGVTVENYRRMFGSVRLRYFGPRPLVEDDSVRSRATRLLNLQLGYELTPSLRLALDGFNVLDAKDSDIDYYYPSRLPGEPPDGVADLHFHPALPRTFRINLILGL